MKRIYLILIALLAPLFCNAAITLPYIVGDNMVLQQNTTVKVWGWADSNATVKCTADWLKKPLKAVADSTGYWEFSIQTLAADHTPHCIVFKDSTKSEVKVSNILFGEVWVAGGQSNMEMPLRGFWCQPVKGSNVAIAEANRHPELRMITIKRDFDHQPQDRIRLETHWQVASSETVADWSAVGYYFAKFLQEGIDCPVGIISANWGGTKIEAWMPQEVAEQFVGKNYQFPDFTKTGPEHQPYLIYNCYIPPIINYTIAGFIFYQGCSNLGQHNTYPQMMQAMVSCWRDLWGLGELPFYYVEIAPYSYGNSSDTIAALLREAQFKAQSLIPNSYMITTNDLYYDYEDGIHPVEKEKVGQRLAWCALARDYGHKGINYRYPTYKSHEVLENGHVIVEFNDVADFAYYLDGKVNGFELAGEDGVFHKAQFTHIWYAPKAELYSDEVPNPVYVRYCFRNALVGNLTSERLMPVVPFRTDNL